MEMEPEYVAQQEKIILRTHMEPMAGMKVRVAHSLPSLDLQLVNENTRFLCLLFRCYAG